MHTNTVALRSGGVIGHSKMRIENNGCDDLDNRVAPRSVPVKVAMRDRPTGEQVKPAEDAPRLFIDDSLVRNDLARRLTARPGAPSTAIHPLSELEQCETIRDYPACIVCCCDVNGAAQLGRIRRLSIDDRPPVVMLIGDPTGPDVLEAVQLEVFKGARFDCPDDRLAQMVHDALQHDAARREYVRFRAKCCERYRKLSEREHMVVSLIVQGHLNKNIATLMGVSTRSIENWRSGAHRVFGVRSVSELTQRFLIAQSHLEALARQKTDLMRP